MNWTDVCFIGALNLLAFFDTRADRTQSSYIQVTKLSAPSHCSEWTFDADEFISFPWPGKVRGGHYSGPWQQLA